MNYHNEIPLNNTSVAENWQLFNDKLADKGHLVTTSSALVNWARTGSLHLLSFGWRAAPLK